MKQVALLNKLAITFYNFGTIKNGRKKVYDYYQVDTLTELQERALLEAGCILKKSYKQYAPELKSVLICFN